MITVTCKCGKRLTAPDSAAGRRAKCPACGAGLMIPDDWPVVLQPEVRSAGSVRPWFLPALLGYAAVICVGLWLGSRGHNAGYLLAVGLMLPAGVAVWFAPALVARSRRHPSASIIGVLCLLAGWIPLVWVGLMIWAHINPDASR